MRFSVFSTLLKKNAGMRLLAASLALSTLASCSIKPRSLALQEQAAQALKEGKPVVAKALFNQAIESANQTGQPADTLESYRQAAILSIGTDPTGKRPSELANRAVELAEQKYGIADPRIIPYLSCAGQVAYRHHDFETAEKFYSRALSLHDAARQPDDLAFSEILGGLISASCAGGKCIDAEPLYKRLIAVRTRELGADHEHTLSASMMYAENCERRKKYAQAREIYMTCVRSAQNRNPQLLPALLSGIGRLYNLEGRYTEAEQALNSAARLIATNPQSPDRYRIYGELATTNAHLNRRPQAEMFYKLAIEAATRATGGESPETTSLRSAYDRFKTPAN